MHEEMMAGFRRRRTQSRSGLGRRGDPWSHRMSSHPASLWGRSLPLPSSAAPWV